MLFFYRSYNYHFFPDAVFSADCDLWGKPWSDALVSDSSSCIAAIFNTDSPAFKKQRILLDLQTCPSHTPSSVRYLRLWFFRTACRFLCGYPMGSKVTADLKREGKITVNEASYLLSFCNQTSPMFLISYIFYIHLKRPDLLFPGMLLIEGVPILMSIPFRKIYCPAVTSSASSPSPHFTWNMLDDCIMQSFETITKIGGYIIIFSVFLQFGKELPFTHPLLTFLFLPSLEITNGIALICNSGVPTDLAFVLATGLASFGGWCSVAQTYSMIRGSGLSIGDYIAKKLIITGITSLLAYIYIFCF